MAESKQTILSYLKNKNSPYGPYTWQSVNGEVKVQWLPDEGRGWIDIENPKGVKGASGFRKLMRSTLPKLDAISEIPAKWEWNPDDVKKGGIYEYLGPKMKGSFKANPNMPNKAAVWDTRPKSKGSIMSIKKKDTPKLTPNTKIRVDGENLKVDGNGLRTPSNKERAKGLPRSPEAAKKVNLNSYINEAGDEVVMRYAGPTQKANVTLKKIGISARQELADSRKSNRFGLFGNKTKRGDMERWSEPNALKRKEANKLMAQLRKEGLVGHHAFPVSKIGQGAKEAFEKGGQEALDRFLDAYQDRGHNPKGILGLTHKVHDKIHNVDEPKLHRAIKRAGKAGDKIFGDIKKLGQGSLGVAPIFMMSPNTANLIHEGKNKEAAVSYRNDLLTTTGAAAGFKALSATTQSLIRQPLLRKGAKKLLTKGAQSLAKKAGASLVGGPTMPAIMTALLAKDVYDVTDALTGGSLTKAAEIPEGYRYKPGSKGMEFERINKLKIKK